MIQSYQVAGRAVAENLAEEILEDDALLVRIFQERIQNKTHEKIAELFLVNRFANLSIGVAQSALSIVFKRLLSQELRQEIVNGTKYVPTKEELSRGGRSVENRQPIREKASYSTNGKYLWDERSDAELLKILLDPKCQTQDSKRGDFAWNIIAKKLNRKLKLTNKLSGRACRNRYIKLRKRPIDDPTQSETDDQSFDPTNAASSTNLVE